MPRWQPPKLRTRIKVIECGRGHWDEQDHGLDIPHGIHTIDFKVTGTGHERIVAFGFGFSLDNRCECWLRLPASIWAGSRSSEIQRIYIR